MNEQTSDFLTTRELADLLRIKERKVYELAAANEIPCLRVTGKLLFPRDAIDTWLASHTSGPANAAAEAREPVFAGSHDPLLDWALRESGAGLATYLDGSLDGVERFAARAAVAAGLHVRDPSDGEWNVPLVARRFARQPVALLEFAWRERGLIVAPGEEANLPDITALRGRRVVPRQAAAGSQGLLEQLLSTAGLALDELDWTAPAHTETDAALAVLEGKADAAFGLLGLARRHRLGFVTVIRERFDLLVDRRAWFQPPLQRLVGFCGTPAFRAKATELHGYDVAGFGTVHFNG